MLGAVTMAYTTSRASTAAMSPTSLAHR